MFCQRPDSTGRFRSPFSPCVLLARKKQQTGRGTSLFIPSQIKSLRKNLDLKNVTSICLFVFLCTVTRRGISFLSHCSQRRRGVRQTHAPNRKFGLPRRRFDFIFRPRQALMNSECERPTSSGPNLAPAYIFLLIAIFYLLQRVAKLALYHSANFHLLKYIIQADVGGQREKPLQTQGL